MRFDASLVKALLRVKVQSGDAVVCCNTQQEWNAGGLMGRPFFVAFCETCFTLYVNRATLRELKDFAALEGRRRREAS